MKLDNVLAVRIVDGVVDTIQKYYHTYNTGDGKRVVSNVMMTAKMKLGFAIHPTMIPPLQEPANRRYLKMFKIAIKTIL